MFHLTGNNFLWYVDLIPLQPGEHALNWPHRAKLSWCAGERGSTVRDDSDSIKRWLVTWESERNCTNKWKCCHTSNYEQDGKASINSCWRTSEGLEAEKIYRGLSRKGSWITLEVSGRWRNAELLFTGKQSKQWVSENCYVLCHASKVGKN